MGRYFKRNALFFEWLAVFVGISLADKGLSVLLDVGKGDATDFMLIALAAVALPRIQNISTPGESGQ